LVFWAVSWLNFGFRRLRCDCHQRSHEVAEVAIRLYGFKSAVKICRGLDVAVSEDASNRFIVARLVSEPDRRGGMAKLMNGDRQAGGLFDPLRDLTAEGLGVLTSTALAGE
jgi:hypothetical protein